MNGNTKHLAVPISAARGPIRGGGDYGTHMAAGTVVEIAAIWEFYKK
jgi:hypothetical protein